MRRLLTALMSWGGGFALSRGRFASPGRCAVLLATALVSLACSSDEADDGASPEQGNDTSGTTADAPETPAVSDEVLVAVGDATDRYDDPALWVCRGRMTDEVCTEELATTVIASDGSSQVLERDASPNPAADCFYVYPTVDLRQEPGNASLTDSSDMELMVRQQAAQFSSLCRVFAPLYEQATIGSYRLSSPAPPDLSEPEFELAYEQVLDAFRWYMANENNGRPIVLLGHSQGSDHLARLTQELFDTTPALADQLVMAALIGAGGFAVNVAESEPVGGTFETLPLCTEVDELACIVAYNSYSETSPPTGTWWASGGAPGTLAACANPAELVHDSTKVTSSTFDYPRMGFDGLTTDIAGLGLGEVTTQFVTYPEAFEAQCIDNGSEAWLQISPVDSDDQRPRIPIDNPSVAELGLGLHLLDYQLLAGDLFALADAKIDAAVN